MLAGSIVAVPSTDVFVYTLHLPSITNGVEDDSAFTDYQFSWVGPEMFNAAPNSACPTVCGPVLPGSTVTTGESFDHFSFTSSGSDAEVDVLFSDFSGADFADSNTVTFKFVESDAFWAAPGSFSFPTDGSASFVIGTAPVHLTDTVSTHATPAPTNCQQCSLTVQDTPEPNTSALIGGAFALLAVGLRKRFRRAQ
ncbi:MAG TPA: hypothetical protein VN519_11355 [Bryobacteraceae bacterium]|nr:hypothetical protein [Bryobacteraceae bacterium]